MGAFYEERKSVVKNVGFWILIGAVSGVRAPNARAV